MSDVTISAEEFKREIQILLIEALPDQSHFTVELGDFLCIPEKDWGGDGVYSMQVKIKFKYENCERSHNWTLGCNEHGYGIELGEDGDLELITKARIASILYFDLALSDLADEFIN